MNLWNRMRLSRRAFIRTSAVLTAADEDLVEMRELPLRVTDDGYTIIDRANGRPVNCAVSWKDIEAFKRRLVSTLIG